MKPTIEWIKVNFKYFNQKYFEGKLPTPKFKTSFLCFANWRLCWGYYDLDGILNNSGFITHTKDNGVICLSTMCSRSEKAIQETLLHEMTHEYVSLIKRVRQDDIHGSLFKEQIKNMVADGYEVLPYAQKNNFQKRIESLINK